MPRAFYNTDYDYCSYECELALTIKSLETKLKEMTYNYQGSMSDCDHYEDVIKKLEAELALSEKKLGVAVDFIEAVHDYDQEFISDYCLEKIKEIEGME